MSFFSKLFGSKDDEKPPQRVWLGEEKFSPGSYAPHSCPYALVSESGETYNMADGEVELKEVREGVRLPPGRKKGDKWVSAASRDLLVRNLKYVERRHDEHEMPLGSNSWMQRIGVIPGNISLDGITAYQMRKFLKDAGVVSEDE